MRAPMTLSLFKKWTPAFFVIFTLWSPPSGWAMLADRPLCQLALLDLNSKHYSFKSHKNVEGPRANIPEIIMASLFVATAVGAFTISVEDHIEKKEAMNIGQLENEIHLPPERILGKDL